MKYGYIRVSDIGMSIEEQTRLLFDAGCDRLFTDLTRDGKVDQIALNDMLGLAQSGDIIVIATLDRLGGSLAELIYTLSSLNDKGIKLLSLSDELDTQNSDGNGISKIIKAFKKFDEARGKEKNKVGLRSARARGKLGGRPRKMDKSRTAMAKSLYKDKKHSIDDICDIMKVSRATLYRYLK